MLSAFLGLTALTAAVALSVPAIIYSVECLVGSLPLRAGRCPETAKSRRVAVAVLVPAHDEEEGIDATLANIKAQLRHQDRLVVVADNCSDRTAEIARAAGAEVFERFDAVRRGKGFALDAGIRYLKDAPPDIVLLVDADCFLGPNSLDVLAEAVIASGRPSQSCNLMTAPAGAPMSHAVAEFAFRVKNYVRPLGLSRLGLPCQVTTGIAMTWSHLSSADVANSNRAEDMKLGLDLASAGYAAKFCRHAQITSQFPTSKEGTDSQRRRWEGGHLTLMRSEVRSLFTLRTLLNPARLALTLDLTVPPLTLLVFHLVSLQLLTAMLAIMTGTIWPLVIATANLILVMIGTIVAWLMHGREALPASVLYRIPLYVLWKFKFYPRTIYGGDSDGWVRTDRRKDQAGDKAKALRFR